MAKPVGPSGKVLSLLHLWLYLVPVLRHKNEEWPANLFTFCLCALILDVDGTGSKLLLLDAWLTPLYSNPPVSIWVMCVQGLDISRCYKFTVLTIALEMHQRFVSSSDFHCLVCQRLTPHASLKTCNQVFQAHKLRCLQGSWKMTVWCKLAWEHSGSNHFCSDIRNIPHKSCSSERKTRHHLTSLLCLYWNGTHFLLRQQHYFCSLIWWKKSQQTGIFWQIFLSFCFHRISGLCSGLTT